MKKGDKIRDSVSGNVFAHKKLKNEPKIPLVRAMQQNERKLSENLKIQREKDSIRKLKRKEKEAKSESERKRVRERNELKLLFDKIVKKKMDSSINLSVNSPTPSPKNTEVSKCLDFSNILDNDIDVRRESASEK